MALARAAAADSVPTSDERPIVGCTWCGGMQWADAVNEAGMCEDCVRIEQRAIARGEDF